MNMNVFDKVKNDIKEQHAKKHKCSKLELENARLKKEVCELDDKLITLQEACDFLSLDDLRKELAHEPMFTREELKAIGSLVFRAYPNGGTMSEVEHSILAKCEAALK